MENILITAGYRFTIMKFPEPNYKNMIRLLFILLGINNMFAVNIHPLSDKELNYFPIIESTVSTEGLSQIITEYNDNYIHAENSPGTENKIAPNGYQQQEWVDELLAQIRRIDQDLPGSLGVYIKHMGDEQALTYNSEKLWYLSSTIKIPLAIAILQKIEDGDLSFDDELTLKTTDFVDGAGDLRWQKPGTKYTIAALIEKMIKNSDSSATDMLIRYIGEEEFNRQIRKNMVSKGFRPITTIMQVRYDVFSEVHKNAANLSNMDIMEINGIYSRIERMQMLSQKMAVAEDDLDADTIEEAFERYYKRRLNSARLESVGLLLERLYDGELLSEKNTRFLLDIMESITTGDKRIKAGLPEGFRFAQKTGTQIERACNIGIIYPEEINKKQTIIIATCIRDYGRITNAEKAFESIGELLGKTLLNNNQVQKDPYHFK